MHRRVWRVAMMIAAPAAACPGLTQAHAQAQVHAQTQVQVQAQVQVQVQAPINCRSRACLDRLVDSYLAALVAHDPSRIAFAPDARFVENSKALRIGEGLWQTASAAPTTFKIYVPDPVSQQVGFMGLMQESGKPVLIGLRLQVFGGRIVQAEHVLARDLSAANLAHLKTARPAFGEMVPAGQRMPRYLIKGIAYSYYDALDFNDGTLAPLARDCERDENGLQTSGSRAPVTAQTEKPNYSAMDCGRQFSTGMMAYIDTIDDIRVLAVDPITGLAFGLSHFHHSMKNHLFPIRGVRGVTSREVNHAPFDLPAVHIFKISNGKIHQIEAMGFVAPYDSPSGW